jgi:hypothetical protein
MQDTRQHRWPKGYYSRIIIDERHRTAGQSHENVYAWFGRACHSGITARPVLESQSMGCANASRPT